MSSFESFHIWIHVHLIHFYQFVWISSPLGPWPLQICSWDKAMPHSEKDTWSDTGITGQSDGSHSSHSHVSITRCCRASQWLCKAHPRNSSRHLAQQTGAILNWAASHQRNESIEYWVFGCIWSEPRVNHVSPWDHSISQQTGIPLHCLGFSRQLSINRCRGFRIDVQPLATSYGCRPSTVAPRTGINMGILGM